MVPWCPTLKTIIHEYQPYEFDLIENKSYNVTPYVYLYALTNL